MPRIELLEPVFYAPSDPIHWEVDNIPLKVLVRRENLINLAVDQLVAQMRDAIGTQGSMANRLNQSIEADGSLKTTAIDEALHSIEEHTDTDDFVRMTKAESDKLALIASQASNVTLQIYTDDTNFTVFDSGVLKIKLSDTIVPSFEGSDVVKLNMVFPASAAHQHYYGLEPVHDNIVTPDFKNYKVNSISSEFVEDSLRVYVNGMRIFSDVSVYVAGALVDNPWTLLKFTPDHEAGTFLLSEAITEDDVIRIDFDISLL